MNGLYGLKHSYTCSCCLYTRNQVIFHMTLKKYINQRLFLLLKNWCVVFDIICLLDTEFIIFTLLNFYF